jgi:hypothetical protein
MPLILTNRKVRVIGTHCEWQKFDTYAFWELVQNAEFEAAIIAAWQAAWNSFRPQTVTLSPTETETSKSKAKKGGRPEEGGMRKLQTTAELKQLRMALQSADYGLAHIGNKEIDLITSLVSDMFERHSLDNTWTKLRQIYEQEMDRRIYQDKARTGALRDTLLDCLEVLPDRNGEFLVILCYYNFPRLRLNFLSDFTRNKGTNKTQRWNRVPFLMHFLDHDDVPDITLMEDRWCAEELARHEAEKQRQRDTERLTDLQEGRLSWDFSANANL